MEGLRSFFRDTLIYGIAAVLPRVINLLLVVMHTTVFLPEQYSDNTTWYVYAAYFNVILTLGLETSFFRYYTSEKEKSSVISTSLILLLFSSLIFIVSILALLQPVSSLFNFNDSTFTKVLAFTVVADTLTVIPFAFMRVQGQAIRYMLVKFLNVAIIVLLNFILLIILPLSDFKTGFSIPYFDVTINSTPKVVYIFIANLIASLLTLLLLLPEILKVKFVFSRAIASRLIHYGLPIMIGGIAYITNENLDKLAIERISGKEANGIYAACYKLGVFMTLYITAFRLGAEPFFFNHAHTHDAKEKYSFIMKWFVILGSVFMVIIVSFLDIFARVLIRDEIYFSGLAIVPIILLANLFSGIYNNLSVWYKLTDKTQMGMYISIAGGILTIVFLYLLIPVYGYTGAAFTTLIAYTSMAVISWFLGQKYYPVPYPVTDILKYVLLSTVFSMLSFYFLRGQDAVNGILLLLYLLYIWRIENISGLLKTIRSKS